MPAGGNGAWWHAPTAATLLSMACLVPRVGEPMPSQPATRSNRATEPSLIAAPTCDPARRSAVTVVPMHRSIRSPAAARSSLISVGRGVRYVRP